ncbi:MAG: DNA adenine methylase [Fimbriimonadaceae bacterium]|nr:DNA adenine methylase [Fimbriimonadaceae bacterium]
MADQPPVSPFLKWAGGKGQLLLQYAPFWPPREKLRRYVEPFVGGGAVFFHLRFPAARLADSNAELIGAYQAVRDQVEALIELLSVFRNDETAFYAERLLDPRQLDPLRAAARFIYLNRTCFNGLYRVNRDGQFNVPFGKYRNPTICDAAGLRACSAVLQGVELLTGDFETTTRGLGDGDFVYLDPPYVPLSATANFTDYVPQGFGEADQRRLADHFRRLDEAGCRLLLSNSHTPLARALYEGAGYPMRVIQARRAINRDGAGRGPVEELLIANYPLPKQP